MNRLLQLFADGNMPDKIQLWRDLNILEKIAPELHACIGIDGGEHHGETVYEHLLAALTAAKDYSPLLQLAVLLHDVGKPSVAKKEKGGVTFHSHEVKGASIAYEMCKRFKLAEKDTKYVVKLVRHHMFRFDDKTKDKAIKKWLFKVGKDTWHDLFLLRMADRKGNKTNENKPTITRQMKALQKKINALIDSNTVIFKEDLAISEATLKKMIGRKYDLSEVYANLIGLVNSDMTRNSMEWLEDYIKRVYK